ncbi:hypothetical protein Adt_39601 [Abeliophyllum distichum]|uniref:Uncharacterized protein n=1 Tax=Abeliophyllum distichum TaxID=126358 RepID=A0ABD1Q5J7_9LAMI
MGEEKRNQGEIKLQLGLHRLYFRWLAMVEDGSLGSRFGFVLWIGPTVVEGGGLGVDDDRGDGDGEMVAMAVLIFGWWNRLDGGLDLVSGFATRWEDFFLRSGDYPLWSLVRRLPPLVGFLNSVLGVGGGGGGGGGYFA